MGFIRNSRRIIYLIKRNLDLFYFVCFKPGFTSHFEEPQSFSSGVAEKFRCQNVSIVPVFSDLKVKILALFHISVYTGGP